MADYSLFFVGLCLLLVALVLMLGGLSEPGPGELSGPVELLWFGFALTAVSVCMMFAGVTGVGL